MRIVIQERGYPVAIVTPRGRSKKYSFGGRRPPGELCFCKFVIKTVKKAHF